jgi:hypothetical protein
LTKRRASKVDGVALEFWDVIGYEYPFMVMDAIRKGKFPKCITRGLIILIFKGGVRDNLNTWRPIALLTTIVFQKPYKMSSNYYNGD